MAGTRWRLLVRQARPAAVTVGVLKAAIGRHDVVAVAERGPDAVVSIDYDTEEEARDAQDLAQAAAPGALCSVEEFPVPDRLTRDR
jgi:hypothetical protein